MIFTIITEFGKCPLWVLVGVRWAQVAFHFILAGFQTFTALVFQEFSLVFLELLLVFGLKGLNARG